MRNKIIMLVLAAAFLANKRYFAKIAIQKGADSTDVARAVALLQPLNLNRVAEITTMLPEQPRGLAYHVDRELRLCV